MKLVTVVGARPQFVKAAALSRALTAEAFSSISHAIVHTGQHYDENMSGSFFAELGIPSPVMNLAIGSGEHGAQTGAMMTGLEAAFDTLKPDMVLVYGDTNSTLASALVAAKAGIPLAHVEAGLRSFRVAMPEEINRVVTDRLSQVLFCPTKLAMKNLEAEGKTDGVHLVGDVMFDIFSQQLAQIDIGKTLATFDFASDPFALLTIHRQENTDDQTRLRRLVAAFSQTAKSLPVIFPAHPRTLKSISDLGVDLGGIRILPPLPYGQMIALLGRASVVATDSGGLQKEAYFAQTPCVTLRDETEWVETVEAGANRLASPANKSAEAIVEIVLDASRSPMPAKAGALYGDGHAAEKIATVLAAL